MSIQVEHLTKVYGQQKAVNNISFSIGKGEIVGFLGPNGAGKSTSMKVISCFIPPTSGQVSVCSLDVEQASLQVRQKIGYLPEHNPLYGEMYIQEYLNFVAQIHELGKDATTRVEEMIQLTGLGRERKKKIGQLSKGYRQRVGLAQAMIHNPEVLILDEPTSGLDPNQILEIRNLIKEIGQEKTVLLSTHIMQEVEAMCDRIIIINQGNIVADDTTEAIRQKTSDQHIYTVRFSQSVNKTVLQNKLPQSCTIRESGGTFNIQAPAKVDVCKLVFEVAQANSAHLLELKQEENRLEDIFRTLTNQSQQKEEETA